jgi:chemotaxis protein MotC
MSWRFALVLAALLSGAPAEAQTGSVKISDMADELQRIQTRIAYGDKAAYSAQLAQLKAMGAAIAAAKPKTWQDKRETGSLIIYVLSGGSLAEVAPLLKNDALVDSERALARGAIAYITSHEADALRLLSATDLGALDLRLAGQIGFARSVLATTRDPKAAVELLDWARLLAPGGLVEEAALRREIAILAEAPDAPRAARLTRQYANRFGASLYAPDFFRELAGQIGRNGLAEEPANYELFARAASALPADGRLDFLLTLAKAAIVNRRFVAASAAASEALRSAPPNSPAEARARIYLNAARIFSDDYDAALANLQGFANSRLDRSDAALLAAFRDAAAQFRLAPSPAAVEAQAASAGNEKAEGAAETIRDAEVALERTAGVAAAAGGAP